MDVVGAYCNGGLRKAYPMAFISAFHSICGVAVRHQSFLPGARWITQALASWELVC